MAQVVVPSGDIVPEEEIRKREVELAPKLEPTPPPEPVEPPEPSPAPPTPVTKRELLPPETFVGWLQRATPWERQEHGKEKWAEWVGKWAEQSRELSGEERRAAEGKYFGVLGEFHKVATDEEKRAYRYALGIPPGMPETQEGVMALAHAEIAEGFARKIEGMPEEEAAEFAKRAPPELRKQYASMVAKQKAYETLAAKQSVSKLYEWALEHPDEVTTQMAKYLDKKLTGLGDLVGVKQFDRLVELGFIAEGSEYVPEVTKAEVARIREDARGAGLTGEELAQVLKIKPKAWGYWTPEQVKEREKLIAEARGRVPELLKIGEERAAVREARKRLTKFETELVSMPEELQRAYRVGGVEGYNQAVEVYKARIEEEQAAWEANLAILKPYQVPALYPAAYHPEYKVYEALTSKKPAVIAAVHSVFPDQIEAFEEQRRELEQLEAQYLAENPRYRETLINAALPWPSPVYYTEEEARIMREEDPDKWRAIKFGARMSHWEYLSEAEKLQVLATYKAYEEEGTTPEIEGVKYFGKFMVGLVPVVGTIVWWEDMSPTWRGISIAGDALILGAWLKAPRMIKGLLAVPGRVNVDDILKAGRRIERATLRAVSPKSVVRAYDTWVKAIDDLAGNLSTVRSTERAIAKIGGAGMRHDWDVTLAMAREATPELEKVLTRAGDSFSFAQRTALAKKPGKIGRAGFDTPALFEGIGERSVHEVKAVVANVYAEGKTYASLRKEWAAVERLYKKTLKELSVALYDNNKREMERLFHLLRDTEERARQVLKTRLARLVVDRVEQAKLIEAVRPLDPKRARALEVGLKQLDREIMAALGELQIMAEPTGKVGVGVAGGRLVGGTVPGPRLVKTRINFPGVFTPREVKLLKAGRVLLLPSGERVMLSSTGKIVKLLPPGISKIISPAEASKVLSDIIETGKANDDHLESLYRALRRAKDLKRIRVLEEAIEETKKVMVAEKVKVRTLLREVIEPGEAGRFPLAKVEKASKELARTKGRIPVTRKKSVAVRRFALSPVEKIATELGVSVEALVWAVSASTLPLKTKELIFVVIGPQIAPAVRPAIVPAIAPAPAPKVSPFEVTKIKVEEERRVYPMPKIAVKPTPKEAPVVVSGIKPIPAPKPAPAPAPAPVPKPEPKPVPAPVPVPKPVPKPEPVVKPTPKPKPVLPPKPSKKLLRRIRESTGVITWRQGEVTKDGARVPNWWVLMPPYKTKADLELLHEVPPGATIVKGPRSAYRTIQTLTGSPPSREITIDMGIQDIIITRPTRRPGKKGAIKFRRDRGQKTTSQISVSGVR